MTDEELANFEHQCEGCIYRDTMVVLVAEVRRLREENCRLRALVSPFNQFGPQHNSDCGRRYSQSEKCTCGLIDLLKEVSGD